MDIIVTLTEGEFDILESWLGVGEVQPWIQHALDNKIGQRVDATVEELTEFNANKLNKEQKLNILRGVKLKTRKERDGIL